MDEQTDRIVKQYRALTRDKENGNQESQVAIKKYTKLSNQNNLTAFNNANSTYLAVKVPADNILLSNRKLLFSVL